MREWAGRAASAARPLGDRPLLAAAIAALAHACALNGAMSEADEHRAEAASDRCFPDDGTAPGLDAPANPAAAELDLDRFAEAGQYAERAMAVGRSDRTNRHRSDQGPLPRLGPEAAENWQKPWSCSKVPSRPGRLSGNAQSLASSLVTPPHSALRPVTWSWRSRPPRRASIWPASWTTASPRAGTAALAGALSRPATPVAPPMFLSRLRGRRVAARPGAPGGLTGSSCQLGAGSRLAA